jgi:hypothetical protein
MVAVTYTTPPLLAEGTEFSAKFFWNNYVRNSTTGYRTGDLLNLDFAISEHIGPLQIGVTGYYFKQVEGDDVDGVAIPPDGRKAEQLLLGGIVAYDFPEQNASVKLKAGSTVIAENTVHFWAVVLGWIKKF